METKFEIIFDNYAQYNNNLSKVLDDNIELQSLNYFNKKQNLIKVINGGYEESISSYIYHNIFRYENSAFLEQKIYLAPRITPKPDMFFTKNLNVSNNFFVFCGEPISNFTEFGHGFSFQKYGNIDKSLNDFVKWRKLFKQYNFNGEIVTIQFVTHLSRIQNPYNKFGLHAIANRNINLNNLLKRNQDLVDIINMYNSIGTLKKHSVIEYSNTSIDFSIHIFVNLFPSNLTKNALFNRFPSVIKGLKYVKGNNDFWDVDKQ